MPGGWQRFRTDACFMHQPFIQMLNKCTETVRGKAAKHRRAKIYLRDTQFVPDNVANVSFDTLGQLGDAFRAAAVHSLSGFKKDQSRKPLDTVRINAESDRLLATRAVVIIITTWPGN